MPVEIELSYWRERASEVRALADQATHPKARAAFLSIAAQYERLVQQAEARAMDQRPKKSDAE
jgi:hypothetical protein